MPIHNHLEQARLAQRLSQLNRQEAERWDIAGFVGESRTVQAILEKIDLLRQAHTFSVLITGERGTGKELIARAIHFNGQRRDGLFVVVNCSALDPDLATSLFLGHAKDDRSGYLEMAEGGTLFLDEIAALPAELQPGLLQVLEEGRYLVPGTAQERKTDVRVIATTSTDLREIPFRQDLYFRLAQFAVQVPPLRQRREDIALLARHFLALFAQEMNLSPAALSTEALAQLQDYDYPGNVRELKNIIERALMRSRGNDIEPEHLELGGPTGSSSETSPRAGVPLPELPLNLDQALEQAEEIVVRRAMEETGGNVAKTARLLGTNRPRLYRILNRLEERGNS